MASSNLTPDQEQWLKDTGRWSYSLANKPEWVTPDNEDWAKSIYDDPNKDPNEVIQGYLKDVRAKSPTLVDSTDANVLRAYGQPASAPQQSQPQQSTVTQSWLSNIASTPAAAQNQQRNDALFTSLQTRANQSLSLDPRTDPIINRQVDAYRAEQQRGARNALADAAEAGSPNANLNAESRLVNERAAQNTAGFQAQLTGQELTARRDEIAQALAQMQGMLTTDQQAELQRQLAALDAAIRDRGLDLQGQSLSQDWRRALLQNDQFYADLGLNAEDRAAYYDLVRRGLI